MTKQIASHLRNALNTARYIFRRVGHAVVFVIKKSSKGFSRVYRSSKLHPFTRKLSPLPHLALIAAILTPLLSTIILEIHSSRLYKVVETEQLLLSKTTVKKDLIKDTQDAITTIIDNSIKILFNMLHVLGMEVHLKNGRI